MKITLIVSSFLFSFPIPFSPDTRIFVDSCWPSKHVEKNSTKPRYKWIALSENPRECHLSYTLSKPFNVPSMKQTAMKRINPQGNLAELNTRYPVFPRIIPRALRGLKPLELSTWAKSSSHDWRVLDSPWIPAARSALQNNLKRPILGIRPTWGNHPRTLNFLLKTYLANVY